MTNHKYVNIATMIPPSEVDNKDGAVLFPGPQETSSAEDPVRTTDDALDDQFSPTLRNSGLIPSASIIIVVLHLAVVFHFIVEPCYTSP